jgi:hypothetical protein
VLSRRRVAMSASGERAVMPPKGPDTSAHVIYLQELAANAGYSSLVCLAAAVVFVVASVTSHWALRVSSAFCLAIGAHLLLVLMMVMKRVFNLTVERLTRARTGRDLTEESARQRAS